MNQKVLHKDEQGSELSYAPGSDHRSVLLDRMINGSTPTTRQTLPSLTKPGVKNFIPVDTQPQAPSLSKTTPPVDRSSAERSQTLTRMSSIAPVLEAPPDQDPRNKLITDMVSQLKKNDLMSLDVRLSGAKSNLKSDQKELEGLRWIKGAFAWCSGHKNTLRKQIEADQNYIKKIEGKRKELLETLKKAHSLQERANTLALERQKTAKEAKDAETRNDPRTAELRSKALELQNQVSACFLQAGRLLENNFKATGASYMNALREANKELSDSIKWYDNAEVVVQTGKKAAIVAGATAVAIGSAGTASGFLAGICYGTACGTAFGAGSSAAWNAAELAGRLPYKELKVTRNDVKEKLYDCAMDTKEAFIASSGGGIAGRAFASCRWLTACTDTSKMGVANRLCQYGVNWFRAGTAASIQGSVSTVWHTTEDLAARRLPLTGDALLAKAGTELFLNYTAGSIGYQLQGFRSAAKGLIGNSFRWGTSLPVEAYLNCYGADLTLDIESRVTNRKITDEERLRARVGALSGSVTGGMLEVRSRLVQNAVTKAAKTEVPNKIRAHTENQIQNDGSGLDPVRVGSITSDVKASKRSNQLVKAEGENNIINPDISFGRYLRKLETECRAALGNVEAIRVLRQDDNAGGLIGKNNKPLKEQGQELAFDCGADQRKQFLTGKSKEDVSKTIAREVDLSTAMGTKLSGTRNNPEAHLIAVRDEVLRLAAEADTLSTRFKNGERATAEPKRGALRRAGDSIELLAARIENSRIYNKEGLTGTALRTVGSKLLHPVQTYQSVRSIPIIGHSLKVGEVATYVARHPLRCLGTAVNIASIPYRAVRNRKYIGGPLRLAEDVPKAIGHYALATGTLAQTLPFFTRIGSVRFAAGAAIGTSIMFRRAGRTAFRAFYDRAAPIDAVRFARILGEANVLASEVHSLRAQGVKFDPEAYTALGRAARQAAHGLSRADSKYNGIARAYNWSAGTFVARPTAFLHRQLKHFVPGYSSACSSLHSAYNTYAHLPSPLQQFAATPFGRLATAPVRYPYKLSKWFASLVYAPMISPLNRTYNVFGQNGARQELVSIFRKAYSNGQNYDGIHMRAADDQIKAAFHDDRIHVGRFNSLLRSLVTQGDPAVVTTMLENMRQAASQQGTIKGDPAAVTTTPGHLRPKASQQGTNTGNIFAQRRIHDARAIQRTPSADADSALIANIREKKLQGLDRAIDQVKSKMQGQQLTPLRYRPKSLADIVTEWNSNYLLNKLQSAVSDPSSNLKTFCDDLRIVEENNSSLRASQIYEKTMQYIDDTLPDRLNDPAEIERLKLMSEAVDAVATLNERMLRAADMGTSPQESLEQALLELRGTNQALQGCLTGDNNWKERLYLTRLRETVRQSLRMGDDGLPRNLASMIEDRVRSYLDGNDPDVKYRLKKLDNDYRDDNGDTRKLKAKGWTDKIIELKRQVEEQSDLQAADRSTVPASLLEDHIAREIADKRKNDLGKDLAKKLDRLRAKVSDPKNKKEVPAMVPHLKRLVNDEVFNIVARWAESNPDAAKARFPESAKAIDGLAAPNTPEDLRNDYRKRLRARVTFQISRDYQGSISDQALIKHLDSAIADGRATAPMPESAFSEPSIWSLMVDPFDVRKARQEYYDKQNISRPVSTSPTPELKSLRDIGLAPLPLAASRTRQFLRWLWESTLDFLP